MDIMKNVKKTNLSIYSWNKALSQVNACGGAFFILKFANQALSGKQPGRAFFILKFIESIYIVPTIQKYVRGYNQRNLINFIEHFYNDNWNVCWLYDWFKTKNKQIN